MSTSVTSKGASGCSEASCNCFKTDAATCHATRLHQAQMSPQFQALSQACEAAFQDVISLLASQGILSSALRSQSCLHSTECSSLPLSSMRPLYVGADVLSAVRLCQV